MYQEIIVANVIMIENFINWIKFIQTLKNSGISLNDIIEYIIGKCE